MTTAPSASPVASPANPADRDPLDARELVVVITPFAEPSASLVAAVQRAGGLGVLDLGLLAGPARDALRDAARWAPGRFGVRAAPGCPLDPDELPASVGTVVLVARSGPDPRSGPVAWADAGPGPGSRWDIGALTSRWRTSGPRGEARRRVWAEVTSVAQARDAVAAGVEGLIARGNESGGPVGDLTTFTLLQHLLAQAFVTTEGAPLPVFAAGGIGPATAAAAVAGGAAGVVLDSQLALVREMELPAQVAAAIRAMDGSETTLLAGYRVYTRPDLPVAAMTGAAMAGAATAIPFRLGARDLRNQFLPVGQDGAFAADLADRHVTAGGVVRAVRQGIREGIAAAARTRPLAPGAPFAAARGLRHPVAQGPMTRVSDRAAFAHAVADEGGLPFLALALMSGEDSRALLEETADLLGDAPWGVGVLGFAPAPLRAAQLAAVHDVRPACAIVAGGRPAQAAPLEAAGIDTFLHVPSPGLLNRFLADGARKFVFEGRECGGHVGPRASFPLWEAQIAGLLEFGTTDQAGPDFFAGLHLLFAGGVHDARSAAMVAAAAGPLAERGASVGVLMGTAYLFTAEAVASGAILPGFQQAALDCERTVLLETSPGHATRCVESAYVHTFLGRRRELIAAGNSRQQMWEELEALNLGRLRVASKGLRREGSEVVTVDPATQARDGMYMIGQVAALRSRRTSIAELHDEVTAQATAGLAARSAELRSAEPRPADRSAAPGRPAARPLDIAIVGMSAIFPDAPDLASFWANIVAGNDAIREVPADRWDAEVYYHPDAVLRDAGRRTPSRWGGFLPQVPFDALAYGIPPKSLRSIETSQLLALEVAARALRGAGYDAGQKDVGQKTAGESRAFDRSRTSVVFGTEAGTDLSGAYSFRSLWPALLGDLPAELEEFLPELDEDSFPGMLANVIAGRVANRLDLGGVNFTVDAACASSLAALDAACKELVAGTSDMVLCGGVDTHAGAHDFLLFSSVHALSPGGRCRSFDAGADGTSLGEGVAVVVLKRLADAERDGDRIHAVIRAVAGSSDGRALGLTAPRKAGQVLSLERAYGRAGISPSEIGLLEAHATGTVVGDRTELATLTEVFTNHGATPGQCAVGSVKSQIGHTKCAAGLAGLIKMAKAVETGVRPPTLHIDTPNAYWDAESSPFYFDDVAKPWVAPAERRHAGVSAFGFGGTNFHVVLSAYDGGPEPAHGLDSWPAELFVVRGTDRVAATRALDRLAELIVANDAAGRPFRLRDLASTVCAERGGPVQLAFVAGDLDALPTAIDQARTFTSNPRAGLFVRDQDADPGATAFLFPGQGSQRPGMLADLFIAFPRLRSVLDLAPRWADTMFPPAAFSREQKAAQAAAITDTRAAQPTLGLAGLAVHDLLTSLGVRPDHVAGHSYGELVALCAAGALDRRDLIGLSEARAAAILAAAGDDPGTMAAVSASVEQVRAALDGAVTGGEAGPGRVVVANHNAPRQSVISGPTDAVAAAVAALGRAGISAKPIPVACAFHSPVVTEAATALAARLDEVEVEAPTLPVWSNTTAGPYPGSPDEVRATLAGQVAAPVRFVEQIEAMYAAGVRTFVEAGPGRVLAQLVGRILAGRPHRVVATDVAGEPGLRRLLLALAELAAVGVELDPSALFTGRDARVVSATDLPRRPGWLIDGAYVRTPDGRFLPGGLRPPTRLTVRTTSPGVASVPGAASVPEIVGVRGFVEDTVAPAPPFDRAGVTDHSETTDDPAAGPAGLAELGGDGPVDAVVLEFLRTTRELVAAQRDVVLGYLGIDPTGLARPGQLPEGRPADLVRPRPGVVSDDVPGFVPPRPGVVSDDVPGFVPPRPGVASDDAPDMAAASRVVLDRAAVSAAVVGVIGEQTGYPVEMLEPDLDLEADLSIDSIKRTEILGELAQRLGLVDAGSGELGEEAVEELAAIKTVRGIVDWLTDPPGAVSGVPGAGEVDLVAAVDRVAAASRVVLDRAAVSAAVVGVIGEQTGYPVEMLEPDLDLEADLSIDSIKRTEILGELAQRLGLVDAGSGELGEEVVEELAAIKTVRGIVDWIVASVDPDAAGATEPAEPTGPGRSAGVAKSGGAGSTAAIPLRRFVVEPEIVPVPSTPEPVGRAGSLAGARFLLVEGGLGVGLELATLLEQAGAEARILAADDRGLVGQVRAGAGADGLVWIASIDPGAGDHAVLPAAFAALRAAALGGSRRMLVATGHGGRFGRPSPHGTGALAPGDAGDEGIQLTPGMGLAGLVRTIAWEVPDIAVRLVDVEPKDEPRRIAESLLVELLTPGGPSVVGYRDGVRATPRIRPVELGVAGDVGDVGAAGYAGELPAELGPSSVVLLTGGARGITAAVAVELARRSGCAIELIGRTPPPTGPEDPVTADALDAPALRRALVATGVRRPAEIESQVARLLAEREVRTTLEVLGRLASSVRYHAMDVRDGAAVASVVADVYARHGRLDGVVHGAGILADRLLRDKTPESFDQVYRTKIDGARALLAALRDDVGFVVLFGSVAGVFGNRGQVDYAAANDALDTLAGACAGRFAGRVVSVDWGPWGSARDFVARAGGPAPAVTGGAVAGAAGVTGGGMVSPELAREYARRGIGLIDPADGVAALLRELAAPAGTPAQVVYMCASVESFDA